MDCDGVLADFDTRAKEIFNGKLAWQMEKIIGEEKMWAAIRAYTGGFFRTLPLMPGAERMMHVLRVFGPTILTGCPPGGFAEPEKVQWAEEHFPDVPIITCRSSEKRNYMRPGDILVDDFEKYRHLWEAAGGIFILYQNAEQAIRDVLACYPTQELKCESSAPWSSLKMTLACSCPTA
jgi:5'(3')-deoxyribonucleotidase